MLACCSPDPGYQEAIEISSDSSGYLLLKLDLGRIPEANQEDMLALMTLWWLRWIGTLDCAFFPSGQTWQLHCQIEHTQRAALPQVLRDILAIKNTGFI